MSEIKNVPRLRFPGFTEPWEQRKLDTVAKFSKGSGYSKGDLIESGTPIILYGRLYTKYETIISDVDTYVKAKEGSVYSKGGEVIVPASGETAEDIARAATVYKSGILLGGDLNVVMPNEDVNPAFLAISISNGNSQRELAKKAQGKSVVHIHNEEIRNLIVSFPTKVEQNKIVDHFSNIDNLITLHQRKLDHVRNLKKSMLQKMFPKNGKLYPEIRFPGFTEAWEQRKFTEFVSFFNGLTYTPDDVQETGTFVLRSSNVKNGEIVDADNVYVDAKIATSENVQKGDIIVVVRNGSRALIGKHAQIKASMPNTVIGAFMSGLRSEHSSFVNALLDTSKFENEITKNMGATINQITGYMFSKMEFMIPSGEEQQKIGEYFQSLDDLITLHQRELDHLKLLKKGMLQQMFV